MSSRFVFLFLATLAVGVSAGFALGRSSPNATRTVTATGATRTVTGATRTIQGATRTVTIAGPTAAALRTAGRRHADTAADAKRQARALMTFVERCWAASEDFQVCQTPEQLRDAVKAGIPLGTASGQVSVAAASDRGFVISAVARDSHTYVITRDRTGPLHRTCSHPGTSGCPASGRW